MARYTSLSRAQLSYDYLHTNSTTHEFLFGALAELVDNARDAAATKLNIYPVTNSSLRGGFMLCFLDDGDGMDPGEAADIITFGKSTKKQVDSTMIGMYGNGLKSGSMRIGNDLIVFTKKAGTMTCVFLSRTFHEMEQIDEVIVPMPSFDTGTRKPLAKTAEEKQKHSQEMDLILKYSPFKTETDFMREFDKIDGNNGTLINIYNVKLLDSSMPELDVKSDAHDILLNNPESDFDSDEGLMPEKKSFRAYASMLYVDPRMKIYINGHKVRTKRLASCLYKPRVYKYSSNRFKTRTENEAKKALEDSKISENRAREAESRARDMEQKFGQRASKEQRVELRKAQTVASELRKEAQVKKQMADRKTRSLREPKTLNFIFGINIDQRNQDGMFIYNCSRLIKMYQKVGPQAEGGVFCSGVVGIVDVPYLVLEPTHNKQDFADAKEYRHLQKALGEHMIQYWKDIAIAQQGVAKFWEDFGYISPNWRDAASQDLKYVRKRAAQLQTMLQCDLCLKWRILPFSVNNIGKTYPDDWVCMMNPDAAHNRCSIGEEKMNIAEGQLKKDIKTKEQKEKDLEEEIRRKQEQLEKMTKTKSVTSSRHAKEIEVEKEDDDEEESTSVRNSVARKRSLGEGRQSSHEDDDGVRRASSQDDDEDEPRPKRSTLTYSKVKSEGMPEIKTYSKQQSVKSPPTAVVDDDEDEDDEPRSLRPRRAHAIHAQKQFSLTSNGDDDEASEAGSDRISKLVGAAVEAKLNNKWLSATIVEVNRKSSRWKVKFDKHPQDQHDKWYEKSGGEIRLLKSAATASDKHHSSKSARAASPKDQTNEPTSSTAGTPTHGQLVDDISTGYRTCLRYFLPPQWIMDKESVSQLSMQELVSFPLDDFFDHYERGLRKLVGSFQTEAQVRQTDAEQSKTKLAQLRRMIAKLLKTINEDFDIDPECDTDQVDDLLALCVRQAMQQKNGQDS